MKTAWIAITIILVLVSGAWAQDTTETEPNIEFAGGSYQIKDDVMVASMEIPLVTGRLEKYGNVILSKNRERQFSTPKEIATDRGEEIYTRLMGIKSERGLFALNVVVLNYSFITIMKYPTVEWTDYLDEIVAILESVSAETK